MKSSIGSTWCTSGKMRLLQLPQDDWEELFVLLHADNSRDFSIEEMSNNALKLLEMQVKSSVAKLGLTAHGVSRRIERMEKRALEALATRSDAEELSSPGPKPPGGGGAAPPPRAPRPPSCLWWLPSDLLRAASSLCAASSPWWLPLCAGSADGRPQTPGAQGTGGLGALPRHPRAAQEGQLSAPPPTREGAAVEAAR